MKPENWKSLSKDQKLKQAQELLDSPRGPHLIGQALAVASIALEARNEESSAEDMEILGEVFYSGSYRLERAKVLGE